jgi:hypothetical protein
MPHFIICPGCDQRLRLHPADLGKKVVCDSFRFASMGDGTFATYDEVLVGRPALPPPIVKSSYPPPIPKRPHPVPAPLPPRLVTIPASERGHSGYGIASFVIAVPVLGMNVLLWIMAVGMHRRDPEGGAMAAAGSLLCCNGLACPLSLVGATLGLVGLFGQPDRRQAFTVMGLMGNGVVLLGIILLFFSFAFSR